MVAVMLQGTGSDVGKSVLVAGLCRALANRGLRVRPFKPQNMSNNAAVTPQGGEIGRAQALQALACRVPLHTDMNPVLLKPQADRTSQLVVHGRVQGTLGSGNFRMGRASLLPHVLESFARLSDQADIVVVEGAGSPAEINLRAGDIANMGFARAAGVPVVLVGDIYRGGVIAALVGTRAVLDPEDAAMIRGFLINKFRGDPRLFDDVTSGVFEVDGRGGVTGGDGGDFKCHGLLSLRVEKTRLRGLRGGCPCLPQPPLAKKRTGTGRCSGETGVRSTIRRPALRPRPRRCWKW